MVSCVVKGCKNNRKVSRLHRLPRDDMLLRVWLEKVGRLELLAKPKILIYEHHRICTVHFHPHEFVSNIRKQIVLRTGAIPSLLLPNNVDIQDALEVTSNTTRIDTQVPTIPNPVDQEQGPSSSDRATELLANTPGTSGVEKRSVKYRETKKINEGNKTDSATERPMLKNMAYSKAKAYLESNSEDGNKMCRKNMTEIITLTPDIHGVQKEFVQCTETKEIIEGNKTDSSTERPMLLKIAVPRLYFPKLYLESTSNDDNKMCTKNLIENISNIQGTSGVEDKPIPCGRYNNRNTPSRITNLSQLTEGKLQTYKRKIMDKFVSFDMRRKRRKLSSPEYIHDTTEKCSLPLPKLIPFKKSTIPNFRTVAVQTEPISRFDEARKEEYLRQDSFRRSVDFLRRNLVGHIQKFEGNTFRVDECIISLTKVDQEIEKTETLLVRPNELFSSCELFLDYLFKSDRVQEHRKNEEQVPDLSHNNNSSSFSQKCYEGTVIKPDCDVDKNYYISEDSKKINMVSTKEKTETLEEKTIPDFSKEVQVLLHKLPDDLVEAAQNGHILQVVPTKNHEIKDEHPPSEEIAEIVPQLLSEKLSEFDGFKHSIIGKAMSKNSKLCNESPQGIQNSIEVIDPDSIEKVFVVQANEFDQKKSKHEINAQEKEECETCKVFYKAPYYNNVPEGERLKTDKCKEFCPECSVKFQNEKDLERHLLVNHRTVLKKTEYTCEACPQKFITFKSLMYHNRKTHNLDTVEDVFFKVKCEFCDEFLEFLFYKLHLSECREKYQEKLNQKIESIVKQKPTAIRSAQTVMKQKSPLILHSSNTIERERSKLCENTSSTNTSSEILNKLEVLIGPNDGLNEITIIHLED